MKKFVIFNLIFVKNKINLLICKLKHSKIISKFQIPNSKFIPKGFVVSKFKHYLQIPNSKFQIKKGGVFALISIFLIISIFASIIISTQKTPSAQAAWYNSDYNWQYRQKFQISSGTALTDYQVLLNSASLDFSHIFAHTQEAGADLRFTTSDQVTNIPYWIETYSASGLSAKIWLKVPSVASGTTDIYAYYGNAGASAASSGVNTFIMFDDFSNLSSWTQSGSTISVSDGVVTLDSGTNPNIYRDFSATQPFTAEVKYQRPSAYRNRLYLTTTSTTLSPTGYDYGDFGQLYWNGFTGVSLANNTWYTVRWDATSSNYTWKILNSSGTEVFSRSHGSSISNLGRISLGGTESASSDLKFDWARVRKYSATEPTVALSGSNEQADTVAPANPSTVIAKSASDGAVLSAATIYNYTNPYFDWPAVDAAGGASDTGANIDSGVAGYYSYFGTSCGEGGANPAITKGDYLSEVGGVAVHYSADTDVTVATAITTPGTYCLRMKTKDNFGNVQGTVWEAFSYQFENVAPNAPSYIVASPAGYTATDSYSFSWPAVTDSASSPQSGLAGYQYKRGAGSGDSWSVTQVGTSVSALLKYQDGANIFLVRSIDNAGNASNEVQTTYYYSNSSPTKPTSLTATPSISASNSFAFSWVAPVHGVAITDYAYSINQYPTINNISWLGSATTSISAGPYATQQGANTLYILAKDEGGVYSFEVASVASVEFTCQTSAPPVPTSVTLTDSSDRALDRWALSLSWAAGVGQNEESFDHYSITRSTNGVTFSEIATTGSRAYFDSSGLNDSTTYYYKVKAVDNAAQESVASTVVSKMPTGKYNSPPTIVSGPLATAIKTNQVTITWVTNRGCLSFVSYGESEANLSETKGDMNTTTDHSITIAGLKGGIKYYFKVQSLDELRDYDSDVAFSGVYNFTTTTAAYILNTSVSNITLTSADITWETSGASTSGLQYGTSITYDSNFTDPTNSYVTNHSISLTGLLHSSTYHFKIQSADTDGNQIASDDYVFETKKMPKISNVAFETDYSGPAPQVAVTWKTNVPTTSIIEYYPKDGSAADLSEKGQSNLSTDHKILLSNLLDDHEYKFSVSGRDEFGNLVRSDENVLKTNKDTRSPEVSKFIVKSTNIGFNNQGKSQIFVFWETDEPATSQIEYGEGQSSNNQFTKKTVENIDLSLRHQVVVTDLDPLSLFHLRAVSRDAAGNVAKSEVKSIVSSEVPLEPLTRILSVLDMIFGWFIKK